MGDFNCSRGVATDRLVNHRVSDFKQDLSPDDGPSVVRRKSSVRFLDEVTTIADDVGKSAGSGKVEYLRSGPTNHKWSFEAGGDHDNMVDGDERARSEGESAYFYRWRTDRKRREARMEQNISWLKEEIVKLKHQDQSLMRQFLQLRSVIYQLKGAVSSGQRPVVKLPRIAASVDSLVRHKSGADGVAVETLGESEELSFAEEDDDLSELDDQMGLMEDPYLPEFRGRTVSLLNPEDIVRPGEGTGGYGYLKSRTMSFSVGTSGREQDRAIIE